MTVRARATSLLRSAFAAAGYDLVKRTYKPFGLDPYQDIARLAQRAGVTIDTCFDVGANEGQSARAMLRVFPGARIWSFEPVPAVHDRLCAAVPAQVRALNLALGASEREAMIYTYSTSLVASLEEHAPYSDRYESDAAPLPCRVTTLDRVCADEKVRRIGILKVDTEGHDIEVLKGGQEMLGRGAVDFIVVEFNALYRHHLNAGTVLSELGELLDPLGYLALCFYTDAIHLGDRPFVVANALFARGDLVRQAEA